MANSTDDNYMYTDDYYMFTTLPDFKASQLIWKVVPPILIVFGSIGNILSIVVLTRKSIRNSTTALYLTFLAFSDILVLYTGLLRQWIYHVFDYDIRHFSEITCKIHLWLVYTCLDLSAWIIMTLTMERVMATWWPFRARRLCGLACAVVLLVAIVILLLAVNSHFMYGMVHKTHSDTNGTVLTDEKCIAVHDDYAEFFINVWTLIDLCMFCLVPFSVIVIGNICILAKLMRSQRRLSAVSLPHDETSIRRRSSSGSGGAISSLTAMLLVLNTVFLVTTLPISVYNIGYNYWRHTEDPRAIASLELWWAIVNMLMYANNCVNFLLYCLSGSRFRGEAKKVFCACRREEHNAPVFLATVTKSDVLTDVSVQHSSHMNGRNDHTILESIHL